MKKFAIKLAVLPTNEQCKYFNQCFGCARLIFNVFLNKKRTYYTNYKYNYSKYEFLWFLCNIMKPSEDYNYLKQIDKFVLESAVEQVETAYTNFFEHRAKYPKFKSKRNYKQSYTTKFTNNNIKIKQIGNEFYLQLPKVKELKLITPKKNYKIILNKLLTNEFNIKQATVSCKNNKYYVSLSIEDKTFICNELTAINESKIVGIDLGIKEFATLSNGNIIHNPTYYKTSERQLKKTQRKLSNKKKDSKNYLKIKSKLNKVHTHISNQRLDFLHKQSSKLVNENQVIVFEDLSIKNMTKNHCLAKSITDCGWFTFLTMCKYKAVWKGKLILQADRFYASSKLCSVCGYKNTSLVLKDRIWACPVCKTIHNRDFNASINLRNYGLNILKTKKLI